MNNIFKIILINILILATTSSSVAFELNFLKKKNQKEKDEINILEEKPKKIDEKKSFNLDTCVEYAIKNDPELKIAIHNLNIQKSRIGQAKSDYFPQLGLSTGYYFEDNKSANSNNSYQLSTSINQLIWNFGRTSALINMQKFNTESAGYDLDYSILNTVYNVRIAYFAVLAAKANVDIFERSVKINTLNYKRTEAMFKEGLRSKIDVVNAEVNLTEAKTALIDAKFQHRNSIINLKNMMYYIEDGKFEIENTENFNYLEKNYRMHTVEIVDRDPDDDDDLSDEFNAVLLTSGIKKENILEDYTFTPYKIELPKAIDAAYQNRPDLKSLSMVIRAQEESLKQIKRLWVPSINAKAGYGMVQMNGANNPNYGASANLDFPIINAMDIKYKVEEGDSYLKIAHDNFDLRKKNVNYEIQRYHTTLRRYEKTIPLMADKVRQTLENFELADGRYAVGLNNFIELQDAQINYNNAQLAFVQTVFDYNLAKEELKKAMGVR